MNFKLNVPNALTLVRIVCTPLVILFFLLNLPYGAGYFTTLGIYVLACITDFLDGHIARKYNLITDFGKFMDQIADKFITTTALVLVLLGVPAMYQVLPTYINLVLVLIVVLRDILISGVRMVASNNNVVIPADIFGKVKSFFLDVGCMIMLLYLGLATYGYGWTEYVGTVGITVIIVGVMLAVVSMVNYIYSAVKSLIRTNK